MQNFNLWLSGGQAYAKMGRNAPGTNAAAGYVPNATASAAAFDGEEHDPVSRPQHAPSVLVYHKTHS